MLDARRDVSYCFHGRRWIGMTKDYVPLPGSERRSVPGERIGETDPSREIEISLYLKDEIDSAPRRSREELRKARTERLAGVFAAIAGFAAEQGLQVTERHPARRLIKLRGPAAKLEQVFGTKLHEVERGNVRFRVRTGTLSVPQDLLDKIESVLGLDSRPAATPKIVFPRVPAAAVGHRPNEIAALYEVPAQSYGAKGQCIALIELGGGFTASDTDAAFGAMHLPAPGVVAVGVSGGKNAPGKDSGSDGEVALDIQVAGGVAPGAKLVLYFAPNTDQGFVDATTQAVHDEGNNPSVISISWGSAEVNWTKQAADSMNSAFADAAALGVTVCAASGDGLATDGVTDGSVHVDFPASNSYVLGCGGTRINSSAGKITAETVWNSEGGGSGGGVSSLFPLPAYQKNSNVPVSISTHKAGRGVPDVSADADPATGYRVIVSGQEQIIGGTSAAAPLWAGLVALINSQRGSPIGQPHAQLYTNAKAFRDITRGNNRNGDLGYVANTGWDACTGLGSPDVPALLAALTASA